MAKTLHDCCLACIARNFSSYQRLGNYLSSLHKEILLERMCNHGLFTKPNMPAISYTLFSHTLQRISLCFSSQVDDKCLDLLGGSGCLPTSITIQKCSKVTGTYTLFNTHTLLCMMSDTSNEIRCDLNHILTLILSCSVFLTSFVLHFYGTVLSTDKGIASLARIIRKADELFLIKLKQLTGEGLKNLASRALRHLSLQESYGISESGFMALVRNCPNIEKLCLTEMHNLSDAAFVCTAEVLRGKLVSL